MPDQAWLRIALPWSSIDNARPLALAIGPHGHDRYAQSLGFPQFTRFASEGYPPVPPCILMSPLLCR